MNAIDTMKASSAKLDREYLSPKEMANLLGVCEKTLWTRTKRGEIPGCFKIGGVVRYSRKHFQAWIDSQVTKPPKSPR